MRCKHAFSLLHAESARDIRPPTRPVSQKDNDSPSIFRSVLFPFHVASKVSTIFSPKTRDKNFSKIHKLVRHNFAFAYAVSRTEATGCAGRASGRILILTPGRFDVRKHRVFPLSVRDGCNENRYRNIFEHRGKDVFLFTHWVIVFDNSHQYLVEMARRE